MEFRRLIHLPGRVEISSTRGSTRGEAQWNLLSKAWSARANGTKIFYKVCTEDIGCIVQTLADFALTDSVQLPEHLSTYHSVWRRLQTCHGQWKESCAVM